VGPGRAIARAMFSPSHDEVVGLAAGASRGDADPPTGSSCPMVSERAVGITSGVAVILMTRKTSRTLTRTRDRHRSRLNTTSTPLSYAA